MIIPIGAVLSPDDIQHARALLALAPFEDGRATAGWSARLVKHNLQAKPDSLTALRAFIAERIVSHEIFALAVRPKALTPLIFSRYGAGHAYGAHVDDALIGGLRTDVSFTLFLAAPESYDGGELVIETPSGEDAFKLAAGSLIAYPSTSLHRVEPVRSGERWAAVGWARSLLRDPAQRELLFDLDRARMGLFAREGKSAEFDLLAKCSANLLRRWIED